MRRRRFIKILATSTAGMSLGQSLRARGLQPVRRRGYALGAEGRFTLYTDRPARAQRTLDACFAEIRRLEALFSLYDDQSELCRLNRVGFLKNPSPDWRALLRAVDRAHRQTDGLFDPSIQPLWKAYEAHFQANPESGGLDGSELDAILARTGWAKVSHDPDGIRFGQPGMALSFNGIAQGFVTDRVTQILKRAGYGPVLVELGETRALGQHPEGRPWRIGIQDALDRSRIREIAELDDQALATSGAYGSPFSKDGKFHHLIHPTSGRPDTKWRSLSVIAPGATQADALSTGLSFAGEAKLHSLQATLPNLRILYQK